MKVISIKLVMSSVRVYVSVGLAGLPSKVKVAGRILVIVEVQTTG